MSRASCPVCRATNRCAFLCPTCINTVFARDGGQTPIDQLRKQRNELLDSLDDKLLHREISQSQQIRRWQQLQELREARAKAQRAKAALAQAQQQLSQLAAANSSRRHTLEQLSHQTAAARAEVLGNTLPTVLRYQSLTLSHVSAMLAREQRTRLRELTEIFPLRINAVRDSGGPIQITVCNIRLPEGGSSPAGGWPDPQATSAALGYLLLFVDQVALIMGGPMLHESAHQASTSSIWQPSSFWNRQPPSPAAMLPLNVMTAGAGAGSGTGQAAYNSTTSRYLSTANFWSGLPRSDSLGTGGSAASLAAGTAAAAAAAAYAGASYAASAISRAAGLDGTVPVGPGAYMLSSSPAAAQAAGAAGSSAMQQQGGGIPSSSAGCASSSGSGVGSGSGGRGSSSSRLGWVVAVLPAVGKAGQALMRKMMTRRTRAGAWCRRPSCRRRPRSRTQWSTGHAPCLTSGGRYRPAIPCSRRDRSGKGAECSSAGQQPGVWCRRDDVDGAGEEHVWAGRVMQQRWQQL
ncbi:UV radiation resistance protein and autophagy-related subunit 14-domain-containing protein [Scenedesmus sp. NREL 46B-D3]|nr:UV radiation resistance protein and autophagy-related subunit 14-domain-containing protein [Scenedesmus sp. NREL 46B-D3]